MRIRFNRVFAFLIDWIALCVVFIAWDVVMAILFEEIEIIMGISVLVSFFALPVLFILRDVIFRGRSLGKRIFGLTVRDEKTGEKPTKTNLAVRNLFCLFFFWDGLVLFLTGKSIGEYAVHARVVSVKDPDRPVEPLSKKSVLVTVVALLLGVALFVLAIFGVVSLTLESAKENEEYPVAYGYLVDSRSFAILGAEESDIRLTGYSFRTEYGDADPHAEEAVYTFTVKGRTYEVVCHPTEYGWYVCLVCTDFS